MIHDFDIRVEPKLASDEAQIRNYLIERHHIDPKDFKGLQIIKRSIDARQKIIFVNLRVRVWEDETPTPVARAPFHYADVSRSKHTAIVVGAGPAGLFAALRLIELGIRPIVVERGKSVRERKRDIADINKYHKVDPDSNYSFGEGGAGAFSDGKLYTRSKKRGNVDRILELFVHFGANPQILVDAHPHIGTDKLPGIIEAIRNQILKAGGEVHFETRMSDLLLKNGQLEGIVTANGKTFLGPVILATGHSARDVYRLLKNKTIFLEAKPLAIGVRLEHPSQLIDQIQYHSPQGKGAYLPTAEYSLVTQVNGRGVYSFCMCPGGFVVPAASGPEQVVVNGMSPSNRNSAWSNAGLVVELQSEDLNFSEKNTDHFGMGVGNNLLADISDFNERKKAEPELVFMHWQEHLERCCWQQGGQMQTAPAQRMSDFSNKKSSTSLPSSSYVPGLISSPLHEWMPKTISNRLRAGFQFFNQTKKGFLTNEAILIGIESRTSSPVRISRDPQTLEHASLKNLYPCGEGAGYAGGIVSAAMDGERIAEALATRL